MLSEDYMKKLRKRRGVRGVLRTESKPVSENQAAQPLEDATDNGPRELLQPKTCTPGTHGVPSGNPASGTMAPVCYVMCTEGVCWTFLVAKIKLEKFGKLNGRESLEVLYLNRGPSFSY